MKSDAPLHASDPGREPDSSRVVSAAPAHMAVELRLLQDQKFQALNQLAGGVAHEFNNLIAGVLGSAELLAMDLPENDPCRETLKQIFEASNLGRDFVHRLRAFGQRPAPEFKVIGLQPVIEECVQILRTIIPPRVILQTNLGPDCASVLADAAQIHQVVLDICLHCWQGLADRRGWIKIALENCPADRVPAENGVLLQPGPQVSLTIHDSSPGLEKSAREHLFHPFRSRRFGGTKVGLELFLVRETIRGHGGEIFVDSEPGCGLGFHILLPAAMGK